MSTPWALLWFIFVLFVLILIHELGHFVTAKWKRVKVLEFGIGLPPRIWGIQRGETTYSVNWVPFGGFCKMLGEEDPSAPRSLASQTAGTRLLVLSAGSLVMLLFPLLVYFIAFMVPHDEIVDFQGIRIDGIQEGTPAEASGLQEGDIIVGMDGEEISRVSELKRISEEKAGSEISVAVLRGEDRLELGIVPREVYPAGQGPLGITLDMDYLTPVEVSKSYPPWEAVWESAKQTGRMFTAITDFIADAVSGKVEFQLTGVVGAGQATTELTREYGAWALPDVIVLLSINLGLINLLPVPALDGGRIIFVLVEIVRRGKRVSPETEAKVHMAFFLLLIVLMVALIYWDVARILRGEHFLQ